MDQCWDFLQILTIFMPKFIRIATVLHVNTWNSENFFQFVQILTFLKNFPSNLKFSYILRLSPLCMSIGKWQKPWAIKLLLRAILEQCVVTWFFIIYNNVRSVKNRNMWKLCKYGYYSTSTIRLTWFLLSTALSLSYMM